MIILKRNSVILFLYTFILAGCATSSFKLLNQIQLATDLTITPDRILLECEHQPDHPEKDTYGFIMRVLDQENTVITILQTNNLDKEGCFYRLQKIGKIITKGNKIYIGGSGDLNEKKIKEEEKYTFPKLGTFHGNGQTLQFLVIANEKGMCFNAYLGDKDPCPSEPFPLSSRKK